MCAMVTMTYLFAVEDMGNYPRPRVPTIQTSRGTYGSRPSQGVQEVPLARVFGREVVHRISDDTPSSGRSGCLCLNMPFACWCVSPETTQKT